MENEILLQILERLGGIETRLDGIETRLDGIDTRLDGIDTRLDGIDTRLDGIETRMNRMETRMDDIEAEIKGMQTQMEGMQIQIDDMRTSHSAFEIRVTEQLSGMQAVMDVVHDISLRSQETQAQAKRDHDDGISARVAFDATLVNHENRISQLERVS